MVEIHKFDIYLESTGSTETYRQNTMACIRNVLAELLLLEGDRRVVLVEIIFPASINIVTTKEYSFYTPQTPFINLPSTDITS